MIGFTTSRASRSELRASLIPGLLAATAGAAVALGGKWALLAIAAVAAPFSVLFMKHALRDRTASAHFLSIEIPLLFVLFSDLTVRIRSTDALSANPFDAAGILRAALQGIALVLALFALLSPPADTWQQHRLTTRPFRLYLVYVLIALVGVAMSALPIVTAYRVFEVVSAVAVIAGALHVGGADGLRRIEKTLFWWLVVVLGVTWLNVLIAPHSALLHVFNSPIHWRIQSAFPAIASNTVGFLGVVLALYSMARLLPPHRADFPRRGVLILLSVFGVLTLIGAQYRTGYVAFAAGLVVIFALRGRKTFATFAVAGMLVFAIWGPTPATAVGPFVSRGANSAQLLQLNGRVGWWALAIPAWKTSPVVGKGLLTGTRLALDAGGFGDTSTIHSTWIEALVDTGLLGIVFLALALLVALKRSLRLATRVGGDMAPLLILVAIAGRSFTGQTIDSFRIITLVFFWVALSLRDEGSPSLRV